MVDSERNHPLEACPAALFERDLQILTTHMALVSLDMAPAPSLDDFPSVPNRSVKPKISGRNLKSGGCVKCPDCKALLSHIEIHQEKGSKGVQNPSINKPKSNRFILHKQTGGWTVIKNHSPRELLDRKVTEEVMPASIVIDTSKLNDESLKSGVQNPSINKTKPNRFLLRKQTGGWTVMKNHSPRELLDRKVTEEVMPASIVIDTSKLNDESLNSGGEVKCPACAQGFDSDKAAFGHMRIGTNEGSKGCFKKPSTKKPKENTKPGPDLCKLITSWTVTKKRSPKEVADRKVPVQVPASILIGMSNSTWNCQSEKNEMAEFSQEDVEVADILKNFPDLIHECERLERRMPKYERQENKKRRIEESARSKDKKHTCQICNETFPSHQALGGHYTSHRIRRTNAVSLDTAELKSGDMKKNFKRKATSGSNVCEICGNAYETGQKLGGRKRKHYQKCEYCKILFLFSYWMLLGTKIYC